MPPDVGTLVNSIAFVNRQGQVRVHHPESASWVRFEDWRKGSRLVPWAAFEKAGRQEHWVLHNTEAKWYGPFPTADAAITALRLLQ